MDMEPAAIEILVFGDSTYDAVPDLEALLFKRHAFVDELFDVAYKAIREELSQSSAGDLAESVPFANLTELVALRREGRCPTRLHQALTIVCQLGLFLSRQDCDRPQWFESDVATLGLCTGTISAAVVSGSSSLKSFIDNAARAVAVATRLGTLTDRIRSALELPSQDLKPWAFLVPGATAEDVASELESFIKSKAIPSLSRPYISAYVPNGVTVSGPSGVLEQLRNSVALFRSRARSISLYAAYHAPHLYTDADIDWVIAAGSDPSWTSRTTRIPIISSVTGKQIWTGSFRPLLRYALEACLLRPLRLDLVHSEIASTLRIQGATKTNIISIASDAAQLLQKSLRSLDSTTNLITWSAEPVKPNDRSNNESPKIAIVGMSGRFPEAENIHEFWDLLSQGLDVCQTVPPTRWDVKTHCDPTGKTKNMSAVPFGCWLQNAGLYDPRFFGMSPKEAAQCDPQQRLASLAAYEAMEEAGLVIGRTPSTQKDRIGVFLGSTGCDWLETNLPQDVSTFFIPGGNRAFAPGRINYVFNLCGPSYSIDTACSSSLAAIHLACNSIWRGDCDTAISGGTNMVTNPDPTAGLDKGFFLSRTGNCKTFDDSADGYCRGEAAGVVILKRLDQAIADKDPIRGVILGINTNHSAESEAIVRPHAGAQRDLMKKVLNNAGIHPHDVGYVEMHGTGTQAGDAIEMESVLGVFANDKLPARDVDHNLYLGSVKSNIGHGEGASGASSLVKVLLMLENGKIPPHCGIKTKINHTFPLDLEERQVHIARSITKWENTPVRRRRALINNFSAAGGNTALLLEAAPDMVHDISDDDRTAHIVTISAKIAASMQTNLANMVKFLETADANDDFLLSRLSYTTTTRRAHYPFRFAVSGKDIPDVLAQLKQAVANESGKTRQIKKPNVLMAFTGQGSQYSGMGYQLYQGSSIFKAAINYFDQLARSHGFPSVLPIFTDVDLRLDGVEPIVVQLGTVILEVSLARLLSTLGVAPSAVVGHSLGQYAALNVANVLSDSDMIYLVGMRALLLQTKCSRGTHSMLAVRGSTTKINSILAGETYNVACINGPEATVLAGNKTEVLKWQQVLASQKVQTKVLDTDYAFHSSQADPILAELDALADGVTLHKPSVPVICPLDSKVIEQTSEFGSRYFGRHCRQPVNMVQSLEAAKSKGLINDQTVSLELGPHPTVTGMVKSILGNGVQCYHVLARNQDSWTCLNNALVSLYNAGMDLRFTDLHADYPSAQVVIKLPAYAWDLKNYWLQYVGDWSPRKGMSLADIKVAYAEELGLTGATIKSLPPAPAPAVEKKHVPAPEIKIESTTIHRIVASSSNSDTAELIVEADVCREDLHAITQGHKVNGIALSTPSVYAEMAGNIGRYMLDRFHPEQKERMVDIANLCCERPLMPPAKPKAPKLVRCTAKMDWKAKTGKCLFYGIDKNGKVGTEYAWCDIVYRDQAIEMAKRTELAHVAERVKALRAGVEDGSACRYSGAAAYKMVGCLASFHPDFRGFKESILNSKTFETVTTLDFCAVKRTGDFTTNPAIIDALTQPAGFVLNANDATDLEKDIYVNHGWKSFQIYEPLSLDKLYMVYTQMEHQGEAIWAGKTFVFDSTGTKLVAFFDRLALKKFPKRAFFMILEWCIKNDGNFSANGEAGKTSSTPAPKPKMNHAPAPTPAPAAKPVQPAPRQAVQPAVQAPAPAPAAAPAATGDSEMARKALEIVAEETGVEPASLTDDAALADIGIDSLLSMVISSRFREELGLDIDEEGAMFVKYPTIGDLKADLGGDGPAESAPVMVEQAAPVPAPVYQAPALVQAPVAAPPVTHVPAATKSTPAPAAVAATPAPAASNEAFDKTLEIIAEESGVALEDLTNDTALVDIGIDSLLSMVIGSRLREELNLDLDEDAMMFTDFPTIGHLRSWLCRDAADSASDDSSQPETRLASGASTPFELTSDVEQYKSDASSISDEEMVVIPKQSTRSNVCKAATSVILQGRPAMAKRTLFLFPDGGGSASSYLPLQRLGTDIAVVGLNCPYARDPENMKCSLEALIEAYVNEIKRRQPQGPYQLGGWSSGATFSFVAASILTSRGDKVERLIVIDAPTPSIMYPLPAGFFDWAEQLRSSFKAAAPGYLVPHFKASTDAMSDYDATPCHASFDVLIIWATKGLLNGHDVPRYVLPAGDSNAGLDFLLDDKTEFGPLGWDEMLPACNIKTMKVEGSNHFTIMSRQEGNAKYVQQVGNALTAFLS